MVLWNKKLESTWYRSYVKKSSLDSLSPFYARSCKNTVPDGVPRCATRKRNGCNDILSSSSKRCWIDLRLTSFRCFKIWDHSANKCYNLQTEQNHLQLPPYLPFEYHMPFASAKFFKLHWASNIAVIKSLEVIVARHYTETGNTGDDCCPVLVEPRQTMATQANKSENNRCPRNF